MCSGEDSQHGAGQRPRRGSGIGQSVTDDPTVSLMVSFCCCLSLCNSDILIFKIIKIAEYVKLTFLEPNLTLSFIDEPKHLEQWFSKIKQHCSSC